jgi:hypothetical protein
MWVIMAMVGVALAIGGLVLWLLTKMVDYEQL